MICHSSYNIRRYFIYNRKGVLKFLNRVYKAVSDSRHMRKTTKNNDEIETNASDDDGRYDDKNIERIKRVMVKL